MGPAVGGSGDPNGGSDVTVVPAGGADTTAPGGGAAPVDTTQAPPPPPPPSSGRVDTLIDAGWKFMKADVAGAEQAAFNDAAWTALDLPHTWNGVDGSNGPTTTPAYYRGVGWYRKHYTFPADSMTGKRIYLQFDGSAYLTDAWVNGVKVGSHAGGYAAFRFDVTSAAHVGADNVIAVKVDNSQSITNTNVVVAGGSTENVSPRQGDFTFFGGCYRDVHVLATDALSVSVMDFGSSGVYLKTSNVTAASAALSATVKLGNANTAAKMASVELDVVDAMGAIVQTLMGTQSVPASGNASVVLSGTIMNPHLWNGLADPYLYRANVIVKDGTTVTDAVQQPLGFRFYSFDPNTGFSLNGKSYPLRGVAMHQDHKDRGGQFSKADIDNDFAIVKELGATNIRFAHYQHSQYTYDKTDQLGIIAWAENALVNGIYDTPEFRANTQQQLTEMIRQNYNHPSIALWSLSNEILHVSTPGPGSTKADVLGLITTLNTVAHQEDTTRPTALAAADGENAGQPGSRR